MMRGRWLTVLALVVGCGGSDVDRLCNSDDGPWTLQALAEERCGGDSNPTITAQYMESNCRGTLQPMFDAGTVSIASDEVIDRCRTAVKANTCKPELFKDWLEATAICDDLVVGKTVTGASCSANEECGGASYCKRTGACGLCLGQGSSGALCGGGLECQSGICSAGMCVVGDVPANGQCASDRQCAAGLICRDNGHCQPLEGHLGMTCQRDGDCSRYSSSCSNGVCTVLAKVGEPCTPWTGGDGTKPHCEWFNDAGCRGALCDPLPVAVDGGVCGIDVAACGAGLWCSSGRCYPINDEGAFCNVEAECGPYGLCVEHVCTFSEFNDACVAP
jgi:hypothetical protein